VKLKGKNKILLSWSSGKDCAWGLHVLRRQDQVEVVGLLTTINIDTGQVPMHAVSEALLASQAAAADLPMRKLFIPNSCSNDEYAKIMGRFISQIRAEGISGVAFGDIFLEDIRKYREEKLAGTGIGALFPLWNLDTGDLAREMVASGVRAHITCVDPKQLDPAFVNRTFDERFLEDLPPGVDPCGERGEFHTFVYQGPVFKAPIAIVPGKVVSRDEFVFVDIMEPGSRSC